MWEACSNKTLTENTETPKYPGSVIIIMTPITENQMRENMDRSIQTVAISRLGFIQYCIDLNMLQPLLQ